MSDDRDRNNAEEMKLPKIFAENLSQLITQQKKRKKSIPPYQKFIEEAVAFFGSHRFLWVNVLIFMVWIGINVGFFPFFKPFDPYPFEFLTLSVSLEAIILSVIVLIAQKKLQEDSDERSELDLQINLLSESETTLILKKLRRIEKYFNIPVDEEEESRVNDLIEDTHPENLADYIHKNFNCSEKKKIIK